MRKYLIILQNIATPFEVVIYTTLTGLCEDKNWSFNWLKTKKFPFEYEGFKLEKLPLSECTSWHKWEDKK